MEPFAPTSRAAVILAGPPSASAPEPARRSVRPFIRWTRLSGERAASMSGFGWRVLTGAWPSRLSTLADHGYTLPGPGRSLGDDHAGGADLRLWHDDPLHLESTGPGHRSRSQLVG